MYEDPSLDRNMGNVSRLYRTWFLDHAAVPYALPERSYPDVARSMSTSSRLAFGNHGIKVEKQHGMSMLALRTKASWTIMGKCGPAITPILAAAYTPL